MGKMELSRRRFLTAGGAVVGAQRFLQRVWRNVIDEQTGEVRVVDEPLDPATERVLHRIRETRGGELSDARFKSRMRGEGLYAQTIERLFDTTARKVGMRMSTVAEGAPTTFRRPERPSAQLSLF